MVSADESNAKGDLAEYARNSTKSHTGLDGEPVSTTFNGTEWLVIDTGAGYIDYYTIFDGALYEISTRIGGETQENYDAARQMMEQTLFLAVEEY